MKKLFSVLLAVMMAVSLVACSQLGANWSSAATDNNISQTGQSDITGKQEEPIVIGFLQAWAESERRTASMLSMKETFSEGAGYELLFSDAQGRQENQINGIRDYIRRKVDYIVLVPVAESGWDPVLQEARDAGVPVIIVDRPIDTSDESLFITLVTSDFRKEGDMAVEWMQSALKDKNSVSIVHLQRTMGSQMQIGRTAGLEAGVEANDGWKIIVQKSAESDRYLAQSMMKDALEKHEAIDVVYCEDDSMALGAVAAIQEAGKTCGPDGDIMVISFEATNAGLTSLLEGKINCNVECNPLYGPLVERVIGQLERGENPEKRVYIEETLFDRTNVTQDMIDERAY